MRWRLTIKITRAYDTEKPWMGRIQSWAVHFGRGPFTRRRPIVRFEHNDFPPIGVER